ncbi:hypothetical protein M133_1751 [Bacteroides fragilis str. S24L26]|nr:hypothetical protein M085_5029 [Bacteroides fragilis str. 3986 N(B)19]EYA76048.1 hypothetical protein M133_1751 [Bacteroides fragilis str. S24L26]EYA80632.1 hypothetical protein M134_1877 [Bacteroides fragilis str. S24L34]
MRKLQFFSCNQAPKSYRNTRELDASFYEVAFVQLFLMLY